MEIQVAKSDLAAALEIVAIGVDQSSKDDLAAISTHYLFRVRNKSLQIMAFNQRVSATTTLKCEFEGEEDNAMTIASWRLHKWLGGVADALLTFVSQDSGVQAASPRSTIRMKSLDPSKFPFWDKTLSEAKETSTMDAERLASALGYTAKFISDKDTTRPEISQTEALAGSLWATDKKAVTLVVAEELEKSNIRIQGKDIPAVIKFLSLKDTEEVVVFEHDRGMFLRRGDGAMFGAARPMAQFPTLHVDKDEGDQAMWEVDVEEMLAGITCLSAAADRDNTRVRFTFDSDENNVVMAMRSVGGEEDNPWDYYPLDAVNSENTSKVPADGFEVDYSYIQAIVGHFGGKTLRFGISQKGKGGYIRFRHEVGDDLFLTVVVWRL